MNTHKRYKDYKTYCINTDEENEMQRLVQICRDSKPKIADELLDFNNIDEKTFMCFLDMAMPSVSVYSFKSRILFNLLSSVVTESEEAFAYLVFENNFDRWIYQAECKQNEDNSSMMMNTIPNALYQKKVKKRKDNIDTVGKWTDEGMERFNELLMSVRERRQRRVAFEELLNRTYLTMEDDYEYKKCRERKDDDTSSVKKQRVTAMNVLNVAEL